MAPTTPHRQMQRIKQLYASLSKINLFTEKESLSQIDQLLATRIFLFLLLLSLTIIIAFTTFTVQTQSVTITSPSESIFRQLSHRYSSTLSCPCRQTIIRQDQFLSFDPQYHPICSSKLVNQSFISSLSNIYSNDYDESDYHVVAPSHFQILALFCRTIPQMISDSLTQFASEHLITTEVLSYQTFDVQVKQLVKQLQATIATDMKHTSDFLWLNILQNSIYSALRTNYVIETRSENALVTFFGVVYYTSNGTCTCNTNITCIQPAAFYNVTGYLAGNDFDVSEMDDPSGRWFLFTVPGIMAGCLPYNSLLQSTLQCFYSQSCLNQVQHFIAEFSLVSPLSSSRFDPKTTVGELFNQLFLESWNEKSNFTSYFEACSPHTCTYSYDRRFNFLYALVTVISLFGGLRKILDFTVPFIVKIVRRLLKGKDCSKRTTDVPNVDEVQTHRNFKDRLISLIDRIKNKVVTLNMFPYSSDMKNGLYSTRIYIGLLIIAIMILIFYTSLSVHTHSMTIFKPSLNEYEQLYRRYPATLVCPCTRLSVSYSSIIDIEPRYHSVCSSDWIRDDIWLLYFRWAARGVSVQDFRGLGSQLFILLQTLCKMSNKTVEKELSAFNQMQLVTDRVLSNEKFNVQVSAFIRQFQQQTVDSFLGLFELVRGSIQLNQFIVNSNTNAHFGYLGTGSNRTWRPVPNTYYDNNCSCGTNVSCTRPQGFYCLTINCKAIDAKPNQTIPGLVRSCLPVDSLLESSLQCFYNRSCIEMLIQWRSFGYRNLTIDPRVLNVTSLNSMTASRFSPYTKLENIVSQLFIEDWFNTTNFSSYYDQCAPEQCTYSYEQRFDRAYIIASILGIVGGLSVTLRILVPFLVKVLRRVYHHCRKQQTDVQRVSVRETNNYRKLSIFVVRLRHSLLTMNFYRKSTGTHSSEQFESFDEILLRRRQQIATRFYVILFVIALVLIIIITAFNAQIHSIIVSTPTPLTIELLQAQHSSTLSCPCSQIAIPYSDILSTRLSASHQICSSYFITSDFIDLLWEWESSNAFLYPIDGKILSTEFRLLSSLCSLARKIIEQNINRFSSRELISLQTMTEQEFQIQIDALVSNFIIGVPTSFRRIHNYIIDMLHANQLHNLFFMNWNLYQSTTVDSDLMSTSPISFNESDHSCSCHTFSNCLRSSLMHVLNKGKLSGLVIGCLPVYGLRLSTLECFYSPSCLKKLATFVYSSYVPLPMNSSIETRFTPILTVPIGTLIDELFIERWQTASNYSSYFSRCAPLYCRYTYVERHSAIYMLTTFLGLYGGLTVGMKFLVWCGLSVYWKVWEWFSARRGRIEPMNNN